MRVLLNVVFAGLWMAIGYALAALVACLLIITIPFGIGKFTMVPLAILPLGREIVPADDPRAFGVG